MTKTLQQHQLFIDGKHVPALAGRVGTIHNPANGQPLTAVAEGDPEDVDLVGGMKQSGLGRELGLQVLDHYSEWKSVFINTQT
ncbi:MAG: hypothetical protein ACRDGA_09710 [Bacteroidota bacterium]